jgi:hypothetical protein
MGITLDLIDELIQAVNIRAVLQDQKLKYAVADLLRRSLAQATESPVQELHRVVLSLIQCARVPGSAKK